MSSGLLRELTALANAWTTSTTWWIFTAVALAGVLCLALRSTALVRRLAAPGARAARRDAACALLLLAAALGLRLLLPERVPYTFNDEYEYVAYARQLAASGRYLLWTGPPAGVYLYALASLPFGASMATAFATTIVLGSVTPLALWWTLRRLGVARAVALCAAVLLALAPLHVKHAASASLEVASLLFLLLAIGTFLDELRAPGALAALAFTTSLFFALTVRVENWTLLLLLPLAAWLWRADARRPPWGHAMLALLAVTLAAAYLPGILAAPIRYAAWWKSRLPALQLLATNLAFWTGGEPLHRKLPLALGALGALAAARRTPRAAAFWLAFATLLSLVFVAYGLNIGWREEAHQPPPWGSRAAGHDMFRFDVILLPAVVFVLASGLVALWRIVRGLVRGDGAAAAWPRPARLGAAAAVGGVLVALLLANGEARSYHPLAFVASPYNRAFEIAEYRFLRDALAGRHGTLYVLPPSEGVVPAAGIAVRPLAALDAAPASGHDGPAFLYVNARQLGVGRYARAFAALQRRHVLDEVARRTDGHDVFVLYAIGPRDASARAS